MVCKVEFNFVAGEIGGNMGLMLGCSFLTICEFLEFLWDVVISGMKKKLRPAQTPPIQ